MEEVAEILLPTVICFENYNHNIYLWRIRIRGRVRVWTTFLSTCMRYLGYKKIYHRHFKKKIKHFHRRKMPRNKDKCIKIYLLKGACLWNLFGSSWCLNVLALLTVQIWSFERWNQYKNVPHFPLPWQQLWAWTSLNCCCQQWQAHDTGA